MFGCCSKVFPPESGWPFPKFYGTCGRVIVVEDAGPTLDAYLDKSWGTRVHLALSVLQLARQLTLNTDGWALYLTDPSMENFAVDKDLDVKVVDLEHVIVVDLWSLPVQHSSGTQLQFHSYLTKLSLEGRTVTTKYSKDTLQLMCALQYINYVDSSPAKPGDLQKNGYS